MPEDLTLEVTAYDVAARFVGVAELPGSRDNPFIMAMLTLDQSWPGRDEVPWCSAFANFVAWILRLPRSKSLAARSWLGVGVAVNYPEAEVGFDVVVLSRGPGAQPGPEVVDAPGHVGFFSGWQGERVALLGGNQGDRVCVAHYPTSSILGVRRLLW